VPAYNEAEGIGAVLDTIITCMLEAGVEYELIVVDDGSSDGTDAIVEAKGVRIIRHKFNRVGVAQDRNQAQFPIVAILTLMGPIPWIAAPTFGCIVNTMWRLERVRAIADQLCMGPNGF
jgi:glycosyltransferase involved in cell wall biosynthesis